MSRAGSDTENKKEDTHARTTLCPISHVSSRPRLAAVAPSRTRPSARRIYQGTRLCRFHQFRLLRHRHETRRRFALVARRQHTGTIAKLIEPPVAHRVGALSRTHP